MKAGNKAVGHPVNVATGEVFLTVADVQTPGRMLLKWERRYSTSLLKCTPGVLGPGWAIRYFSSLNVTEGGFDLITPEGEQERFDDPEDLLERGEKIIHYGTFQELEKRGEEYCLTRWNVDTGDVERFCYGIVPGSESAFRLIRIEDVTGQAIDVEWNSLGQLQCVRQRLEGRSLSFTYLHGGLLDAVTLHGSKEETRLVAKHDYDEFGRLIQVTDGIGRIQGYAYDKGSRLTREELKDGAVFSFQYDAQGRCVRTSGLDNFDAKAFRYLDSTGFTEVVDSRGYTSIYQWLPSGQIVTEVDALGGRKETEYDEEGRIITRTDPSGGVTTYEYDDRGNRCKTTDPANAITEVRYNDNHQPVKIIDPGGQEWARIYDQQGNCTLAIDPEQCEWRFAYDVNGNLVGITNPYGVRRQFFYRPDGVLNGSSDWEGARTDFETDGLGRLVTQEDVDGKTTKLTYDNADRLIAVQMRDGGEVRYHYGDGDNLTRIVDQAGRVTRYRYGTCGRLLDKTDALGQTVHYAWGSEPQHLEKIINEKGECYRFEYDAVGRVSKKVTFDGRMIEFEYDPSGNCRTELRNGEFATSFEYDAVGRVVKKATSDGKETTLEYDVFGDVTSATNEVTTIEYKRDYLGRIDAEIQGDHTLNRKYDLLGRVLSLETSLGLRAEYKYDANGTLRSIRTENGEETRFDVDELGREIKRELPGGLALWQQYNDLSQITAQTLTMGEQLPNESFTSPGYSPRAVVRRDFNYDVTGNIAKLSDSHWGDQTYNYDSTDRLTRVQSRDGTDSFTYDPTGNILSATQSGHPTRHTEIGQGNPLITDGHYRFEYDEYGRLIRKIETQSEDAPQEWRYEWDGCDQLVSVVNPNGEQWNYFYDPIGRRVLKVGPTGSTGFVWDHFDVLHETKDKSVRTWIYDPYAFKPLAQLEGDDYYSIISDHLGTPRELLDRSGRIAWRKNLRVWGQAEEDDKTWKVVCPLRFAGQYEDDESGLHYNCFRYYSPAEGSYISPDPIGIIGGLNEYSYCRNPVNWIDPYGLNECGDDDEEHYVYRVLRDDEDPDNGLVARNPNATYTPEGFVLHGSRPGFESQFIACSKTLAAAQANRERYGSPNERIVRIDTRQASSTTDLTGPNSPLRGITARNRAAKSQEVLLTGPIPDSAITPAEE